MKHRTNPISLHIVKYTKAYLLLCGIFTAGLCIGALIAATLPPQEYQNAGKPIAFAVKSAAAGKSDVLWSSFFSVLKPMVLIWILGFTGLGEWLAGLVLGIKGAFTGFSAGLIIRLYDVKGLAISSVSIIPQHLIIIPLLLFMCRLSMEQSQIYRGTLLRKQNYKEALLYGLALLIAAAIAFGAAAVDGFVTAKLLGSIAYMIE